MLVCPQCQFENPTANKFCQKCGTSLTQNTCPDCGSLVAFDQLNCQNCGAIAGVTWWAILTPNPVALVQSGAVATLATGLNGYLDLQQRYRLLDNWAVDTGNSEREGKVLDCEPFQLSLLEALVLNDPDSDRPASLVDLLDPEDWDLGDWSDSMETFAIPAIAQPYVALSAQHYRTLPAIHNAWQWDEQAIVLLEDRSDFPLLIDAWRDDTVSLPMLQILQWFYQMVELWQALEPWHCQQSLLMLDNLRIDLEDQSLCLQRLYSDPVDGPFTLQDLGQIWQILFAESQKTHVEPLIQLLADMKDEKLTTPDDVRSRIEEIAHAFQPDLPVSGPEASSQLAEFSGFNRQPGASASDADQPDPAKQSVSQAATQLEPGEDRQEEGQLDSDEMPTIVLPMQLFNLEEVGRTDVGRQREHNEDYFGIETQISKLESPSGKTLHARNLYILCDGMGGHAGGEVASALAVDTLRKYFKDKWQQDPFPGTGSQELPDMATMVEAVLLANKAIYDVNQQNARSGSGRMGTTLVLVLIHDTEVAVAHVGDSRLYRYTRKRGLEQVTVDHEVGQREIQRGVEPEIAYGRPDAYQLTQALGPRDEHFVKPDVQFFELNEDMLLLLCSDGLSDNDLLEKHAGSHVHPLLSSQTNLDKGVGALIELANRYNGHDNITAIAIRAKVRPSLEHLR